MATPKFDWEKASKIVIDATVLGDKATCEKHGINRRTLWLYRKRLDELQAKSEGALQAKLQEAKVEQARSLALVHHSPQWLEEIPTTITAALQFFQVAASQLDPSDPRAVDSMVDVAKLLCEVQTMREMMETRMNGQG